jgi:hypothetical protein
LNITRIATALAFAALGSAAAHAAPIPLQNASITATYNGAAAGMLGLDGGFEPGSNTTGLDPTNTGVEFLTADFLFGIDFSAGGALTVIANGAVPAGAYSMQFDFGSSLAAPIGAFTFTGADGASGMPVLSIVDSHTIALDLSGVQWTEFGSLTAGISAAAAVPEPSSTALLAAGLVALGFLRRPRRPLR